MKIYLNFLLLLFGSTVSVHAQKAQPLSLTIGDPAPALRVGQWIKGKPVQKFEKGRVYVLEFWATWCSPCIASMPHLSGLAREYKDKITVIAIDVFERKTKTLKAVNAFVDSMGARMDFSVVAEDSNYTVADWLKAAGEENNGIPQTFVVDAEGRLAWIGHPKNLAAVLVKVVNQSLDIQQELANRTENKRLAALDKEAYYDLAEFSANPFSPNNLGKPDSGFLAIAELVRKEPKLKYAPHVAGKTFSALLKINPHMAYEYGKELLVTPTYEEPAAGVIIGGVAFFLEFYSGKLSLPPEIYQLCAEAYQVNINQIAYKELANLVKLYKNMAYYYGLAGNKARAIAAQEKAIEALGNKGTFSKAELDALEVQLQQYKNM